MPQSSLKVMMPGGALLMDVWATLGSENRSPSGRSAKPATGISMVMVPAKLIAITLPTYTGASTKRRCRLVMKTSMSFLVSMSTQPKSLTAGIVRSRRSVFRRSCRYIEAATRPHISLKFSSATNAAQSSRNPFTRLGFPLIPPRKHLASKTLSAGSSTQAF